MSWPFKKSSKQVYFTEDIVEELSAITGKDKELIADIIKHNIFYLKRSIQADEELVLVNFPNLGKMRFNYYLGMCLVNYLGRAKKYDYLKKKIRYLREVLKKKDGGELKNFNKPLVHNSIRHREKDVPRNILPFFYKYWKILETTHNEEHIKYFK
jgi:hypothetical protein